MISPTTPTPRGAHPGHAILQVPVRSLESWVRRRTAFYDSAYVSPDPEFVHAHVTALGPFPLADERTLAPTTALTLAQTAAATPAFTATFREIATFPTGIIHLLPEPPAEAAFRALTAALRENFPDVLPYGGQFAPVPHLTLDMAHEAADGRVTEASTRASAAELIPAEERITHLDLAWYAPQECRLLARWELGSGRRVR